MALLLWQREAHDPQLLASWYDRIALAGDIDPVTRLANTVAMGRALLSSDVPPQPFAGIMDHGTLAERQAALGLIARHFSPAYAPALKAALVTGEPMVRVQAAAVAVKVRAELKSAVRAALAGVGEPGVDGLRAAALSRQLREIVATGLLEDDDRAGAERLIGQLASEAAGSVPEAAYDAAMRAHLETELLRSGNFSAFRAIRAASERAATATAGVAHG